MSLVDFLLPCCVILAVAVAVSFWAIYRLLDHIERLTAGHVRPANGRPLPDQPRTSPVTPAAAVAHADAMHALPRVRADLPVVRKPTDDDAPWDIPTGVQPVLTEEMIRQRERAEWVRSQLPEDPAAVSDEELQQAMASAMASVSAVPSEGGDWGVRPQLEVEAAEQEERLAS